MIKLVAFDWNGTLLADTLASLKAENLMFKEFGYPQVTTMLEYQKYFCVPINNYFEAIGIKKQFYLKNNKGMAQSFYKHYEPLEHTCRTRGGVKAVLLWLKKTNSKAVIYSNHFTAHIKNTWCGSGLAI